MYILYYIIYTFEVYSVTFLYNHYTITIPNTYYNSSGFIIERLQKIKKKKNSFAINYFIYLKYLSVYINVCIIFFHNPRDINVIPTMCV